MRENYFQDNLFPVRTYVLVWLCLLIALAATIAVARLHLLERFSALGSLFIASVKAGLVLAFFMNLKHEKWYLKLILAIAISALTLLIGLTFADVGLR
ncbi:MAG: cytochrome C oxidase subunit IV family protein [Smithellaceae bacterium]